MTFLQACILTDHATVGHTLEKHLSEREVALPRITVNPKQDLNNWVYIRLAQRLDEIDLLPQNLRSSKFVKSSTIRWEQQLLIQTGKTMNHIHILLGQLEGTGEGRSSPRPRCAPAAARRCSRQAGLCLGSRRGRLRTPRDRTPPGRPRLCSHSLGLRDKTRPQEGRQHQRSRGELPAVLRERGESLLLPSFPAPLSPPSLQPQRRGRRQRRRSRHSRLARARGR